MNFRPRSHPGSFRASRPGAHPLSRAPWARGAFAAVTFVGVLASLVSCGGVGRGVPVPPAGAPDPAPPVSDAVPPPPVILPPDAGAIRPGDPVPVAWESLGLPGDAAPREPGAWADSMLATLSLRQKVGQMIMPWMLGDFAPEGSAALDRMLRMVADQEIGGVIVSVGTPLDIASKLNTLQRASRLPLLVGADLETGAGFRMRGAVYLPGLHDLNGATTFPPLMAIGASDDNVLAYEMGRITAVEARAVGIHLPFAPVLDVNSNPDNPIINTRALGEDPARVASLGVCFIRGIQDHGAVATGKHFPGHGDTETDSHLALPIIRAGWDRLRAVELPPFRAAVDAGIGGIMTAHIALPGVAEEDRLPATLSPRILTGLLRGEMGFDGLIFTDALDMNAVDRLFGRDEAAVRAVLAGADILLMPPDPETAIRGVMSAVLSGRIEESRIDASVRRILLQKETLGLHETRTVSLDEVHERVGIPAHITVADEVAERALTLLKNDRGILPLLGTSSANVLSVTFRRSNDLMAGRAFETRLRQTYTRLRTATLTRDSHASEWSTLRQDARGSDLVVVSLHVAAVASAGSVAIPPEMSQFITGLAEARIPHVVVSFGNPYLLREFPSAQAYLLAWSGSPSSQRAAVRALFGEIAITGRTPTVIPGGFAIGSGIQLPPRGGWSGTAAGATARSATARSATSPAGATAAPEACPPLP
jgi:beta-N-acetylhexosaminidase